MQILRILLTQFRNYTHLDLALSPDINCLVGPNGAGKTNILDALHCLAITRSFRSSQDKHIVQEGEAFYFIEGTVTHEDDSFVVQCNYIQGKGKKILINKTPLERSSEHIGRIPLVAILPGDTALIHGPTAGRRRFLDVLISQYSKAYLHHLIQYDRIISQRNALLKQFHELRMFDEEQLELWDMQLIPHGIEISRIRSQFVSDFQPVFTRYFDHIVAKGEQPEILYVSHIEANTPAEWEELLKERREKDRVNLYTTGGIHRDDLRFKINGQVVKNFGSQGQQKTFAIALKLAQYALLKERTQIDPILLLDDIFDKLDSHRLERIARLLDSDIQGQVFITDTSYQRLHDVFDPGSTERKVLFWRVNQGTVSAVAHEK